MANEIERIMVDKYNTNLVLLSQQRKSRLEGAVEVGTHTGESASPVDQIEETEVQEKTSRHQPITITEADFERRWVHPVLWWDVKLVDNDDKLKMNVQPDSKLMLSQVAALNRQKDDTIFDAFFADSVTGRSGGDTISFATEGAGIVAKGFGAATDTGMNTAKLKRARRLILEGEVDIDDPENRIYCVLNAKLEEDLLNQIQVVHGDYQNTLVLSGEGRLRQWFGINFILSERLNVDASADLLVPFWAKSGMHLGKWADIKGDMSIRRNIVTLPVQLYADMMIGATRIEGAKVAQIICDPG